MVTNQPPTCPRLVLPIPDRCILEFLSRFLRSFLLYLMIDSLSTFLSLLSCPFCLSHRTYDARRLRHSFIDPYYPFFSTTLNFLIIIIDFLSSVRRFTDPLPLFRLGLSLRLYRTKPLFVVLSSIVHSFFLSLL
jgi:hypothetical protein